MLEIKPSGKLVTPAVWDLHLHHVVWIAPGGGPTFASGEEKTIATMPQGYGLKVGATAELGHQPDDPQPRSASDDREVYLTWEIDWVPETTPARTDIDLGERSAGSTSPGPRTSTRYSTPRRASTLNGDGKYVFPDEVPTDPSLPGYEERKNISNARFVEGPVGRGDARLRRRAPASRRRERRT